MVDSSTRSLLMKRSKRALTLFEIMIVVLLISIIGGVLGYNMKGSLDKGKAFRSRHGKEQLHDMLLLALAEGTKPETIEKNPLEVLKDLKLAKDPEKLLQDGWGSPFEIRAIHHGTDFAITSANKSKYE